MSNGTVIICYGVGPVIRKDTVELPHYKNGLVTVAIEFPDPTPAKKKAKVVKDLEKHTRAIQKIIAKATGGEPTEYTP